MLSSLSFRPSVFFLVPTISSPYRITPHIIVTGSISAAPPRNPGRPVNGSVLVTNEESGTHHSDGLVPGAVWQLICMAAGRSCHGQYCQQWENPADGE